MKISCQVCSAAFDASPAAKRRFCSRECFKKSKLRRVSLTCVACAKQFEVAQWEARKGREYCSRTCRLRHQDLDLAGQRYGRLFVLRRIARVFTPRQMACAIWLCRCDCGNENALRGSYLRRNKEAASCGCLAREKRSMASLRHGALRRVGQLGQRGSERTGGPPTYQSWTAMKNRCNDPGAPMFYLYGGRGIKVCDRWASSYSTFLADMGERPPGTSLDRIDPNLGYEPGNCRWATAREQQLNRRDAVRLSFQGRTMSIYDWAAETGITVRALYMRTRAYGWSIERTLTQPTQARRRPVKSTVERSMSIASTSDQRTDIRRKAS